MMMMMMTMTTLWQEANDDGQERDERQRQLMMQDETIDIEVALLQEREQQIRQLEVRIGQWPCIRWAVCCSAWVLSCPVSENGVLVLIRLSEVMSRKGCRDAKQSHWTNQIYLGIETCSCDYTALQSVSVWRSYRVNFHFCVMVNMKGKASVSLWSVSYCCTVKCAWYWWSNVCHVLSDFYHDCIGAVD